MNPPGTRHYSTCMMDDMLVEIDTASLKGTRHFVLTKAGEGGFAGSPAAAEQKHSRPAIQPHDIVGHGTDAPKAPSNVCSPTWAQPSADGTTIFVACK